MSIFLGRLICAAYDTTSHRDKITYETIGARMALGMQLLQYDLNVIWFGEA